MATQTQSATRATPSTSSNERVKINRAPQGFPGLQLGDLWAYRELAYFLIWRDFSVRYKQTVLGVGWVIITPLITMLVFGFVFGNLVEVDTYDVPYPIFSFAALVPWTLFSRTWLKAAVSVGSNRMLVSKIYFAKLILPITALASALIDFLLAFGVLLVMMLLLRYPPGPNFLWVLFYIVLTGGTALGLGFWFSALQVRMRDINYVLPYVMQILLFVTPIGFPSELADGPLFWVYSLNPMVAVCDGFRWALLGTDTFRPDSVLIGTTVMLVLFISGMLYFRANEGRFIDYM